MGPRTDPPPLVDARFPCEIAEDVWVIPDRRIFLVPNIGIVAGKKAALVIEQIDASIIVPGHGSLGQAEIARSIREYFADVLARVSKMAEGEGIETLIAELKRQLLATYPTWEHDRFIDPAVRYFAQAS
jgi:hypothetical protein